MKPVSFAVMEKVKKKTLREFNRWVESIYMSGVQDGIDYVEDETVAEVTEDDLYEILLSVKGIGEKRADEVMRKILKNN